ncbi:MAG TPA: hypothetical protein VKH63_00790, partial [Candidatus Acidoferrum sp.]|nr:hypothetical protein [Candidatus Acidoferrum sp.]
AGTPGKQAARLPSASTIQVPARKPDTSFPQALRTNLGTLRKEARGSPAPAVLRKSCTPPGKKR